MNTCTGSKKKENSLERTVVKSNLKPERSTACYIHIWEKKNQEVMKEDICGWKIMAFLRPETVQSNNFSKKTVVLPVST